MPLALWSEGKAVLAAALGRRARPAVPAPPPEAAGAVARPGVQGGARASGAEQPPAAGVWRAVGRSLGAQVRDGASGR